MSEKRKRSKSLAENNGEDDDDDDEELSWKEKYELQEKQMERIRQQTSKVRELLQSKMSEYESRVVTAEKKRDEALEKLEKIEIACEDKNEAINALREKISRMREERNSMLLLDDEKMSSVKDWVKAKFTKVFEELEMVKNERNDLQEQLNKDKSRRESRQSILSHSSHYYEEVFSELIDGLRKTNTSTTNPTDASAENNYEQINIYRDSNELPRGIDAPFVPPRRSSIREDSRPIKHPIPAKRPGIGAVGCSGSRKSPEIVRELFDLPEDPKEMGSIQNLNAKMLKLSAGQEISENDEDEYQKSTTTPLYYYLNPSVSGMNYEEDHYSVPVYSTLKGSSNKLKSNQIARIASVIRDCPFTGETSDSDEENATALAAEEKTANNLPIKEASIKSDDQLSRPLKTCASYTTQNMRMETLEKAGFLTKLGGRVKNWKRRWFVLSDGKLSYFKSRSGMYGKPVGWIVVTTISQISKSDRPLTFEVQTPNRTYYLTADIKEEVDDWLRVLRNAIRRFSGARLMSKAGEKSIFSGWLTKAKCGTSVHCWAVLKEKSLLFYKSDIEQSPTGALRLREIISVTPVKEQPAADTEDKDRSCRLMVQCIKDSHPTYFVVSSRSEMELWLHHLQRMCSGSNLNNETDFEAIVSKLMNIDGDAGSRYWRNKVMVHSKQLIKESLSSLSSTDLEKKAINMWKSIQLFSTTPINETAIDYHIALAQDVVQLCLTHKELQTEIYCQLIKQTSKYRGRAHPEGSAAFLNDWTTNEEDTYGTIDLNPVSPFVYLQCWQLLALCTSIFLPKLKILWLLKAHLHKNSNESSDVGRYAIYCHRSLERTLKNGERESKPSRMEAIALIARNPFYRIFPMSIPVYFVNNSYQIQIEISFYIFSTTKVFSFDGSTTVNEFNTVINEELGLRRNSESGYSLYSDNPHIQTEHCLQGDLKLCDVVSKWEQACQQLKTGRFERSKAIKLTYKCRLFFESLSLNQTDKEKYFMTFQISEKFRAGHMIASSMTLAKLTAFFAQIAFGDYVEHFKLLEDIMQRIYPAYTMIEQPNLRRKIFKSVADIWSTLKGHSVKESVYAYLNIAQGIPFYGSKLFKAQEKLNGKEFQEHKWISIEEDKLQILKKDLEVESSYEWSSVITFGGFQDDFMLVVTGTDDVDRTNRYLFAMPPGRVLEVTLLIASYINAVVQKQGLNLEAQGFGHRGQRFDDDDVTKSDDIHLWDMESEG